MRILKKILIALAAIIAILLIIALFLKKEFSVKREISINKPVSEVFAYIKYIRNQDHFSKWNQLDPAMKKSYKGTDGTVGFVYTWESKNDQVGAGEQEIAKITENERIDMILRFKEPFEIQNSAYMTTESLPGNSTQVSWGFEGKMPYPMNLFGLFVNMEKEIGNDLETGLTNLKKELEK